MLNRVFLLLFVAMPLAAAGQTDSVPNDSVFQEYELGGVVVSASSGMRSKYLVGNTELITSGFELCEHSCSYKW